MGQGGLNHSCISVSQTPPSARAPTAGMAPATAHLLQQHSGWGLMPTALTRPQAEKVAQEALLQQRYHAKAKWLRKTPWQKLKRQTATVSQLPPEELQKRLRNREFSDSEEDVATDTNVSSTIPRQNGQSMDPFQANSKVPDSSIASTGSIAKHSLLSSQRSDVTITSSHVSGHAANVPGRPTAGPARGAAGSPAQGIQFPSNTATKDMSHSSSSRSASAASTHTQAASGRAETTSSSQILQQTSSGHHILVSKSAMGHPGAVPEGSALFTNTADRGPQAAPMSKPYIQGQQEGTLGNALPAEPAASHANSCRR